jgi:streptomycin 3"-adenylyltransferase
MRRKSLEHAGCAVARSLDEIGHWWTLLIIRDAFGGITRFSDFQKGLGLAKNILSDRLRLLVSNGILERRPFSTGGARCEYHLTQKGRRLRLVLVALRQWGEDNLFAEGEAMMMAHDRANRPIDGLQWMDQDGRPLEPEDIMPTRERKRTRPGSRKTADPARSPEPAFADHKPHQEPGRASSPASLLRKPHGDAPKR